MAADRSSYRDIEAQLNKVYESLSSYDCARADTFSDGYNYNPNPGTYQLGRTFTNGPNANTSIKSNYTRDDYNYYNGNEASPRSYEQKILLSMRAYDNVGIVRNVIDLMADFTCKGVQIVHPNMAEQKFYNEWWNYVDGDLVSERFVNYLYRMANVPVVTSYGKVPVKVVNEWSKSQGTVPYVVTNQDIKDLTYQPIKYEIRRIPFKFTFINPLSLQVIAPELAVFTGKLAFGLRINNALRSAMSRAQFMFPNASYKEMMDLIPAPIAAAIQSGKTLVPLDNDNLSMYYYRKDDWDVWAKPMISAILEDLIMLEKMKLADISALNGAISNVRLWKLGKMEGDNPNNWIIPTRANIAKVRAILANNVGGGTIDLVWGPDIDFKESATQVHHFLGPEKYQPVLSNIYDGLGVPFGNTGESKGMTNSFISMQTFVERLEYGRRVLQNFWNEQIKKVQLAMGHNKPAMVTFDQINLGDDTTYKQLLLGLVDRDLLSSESVLENFGYQDVIEKIKIKRDNKKRAAGALPPKTGAFNTPVSDPASQKHELKKMMVQSGGVAPSQVGVDLPPAQPGEKTPNQISHEQNLEIGKQKGEFGVQQAKEKAKQKPIGSAGRPNKAKDSQKRKMKRPPVQTKASEDFFSTFMWGYAAQKEISDIVTPVLLAQAYNKPNVRSLSVAEKEEVETVKFQIFSQLEPFSEITSDVILDIAQTGLTANPNVTSATKLLLGIFKQQNEREPDLNEMHQIQASGMALAYEPDDNSADLTNLEAVTPTEGELSLTL